MVWWADCGRVCDREDRPDCDLNERVEREEDANANGEDVCAGNDAGTSEIRMSIVAPQSEYLTALLTRQSRLSFKKWLSVMTDVHIFPCINKRLEITGHNNLKRRST
jgi:hypothetical protein